MDIPEQDKQAFIEAARRRSQQKQGGAAFGVYPSSGKRPEKLNVSRDVNMPAQVARGWVAGTLGLPGDIESLGRLALGFAGADVSETPVLPTSEFYQEWLPGRDERPAAQFASGLGALAGGAGSTKVAGAAVKGAKATGKALGPKAAEMAEGYLQKSGLAPSVVKPKGGNWLSGSVERGTEPLVPRPGARGRPASETMREMEATYPPDVLQSMSPETSESVNRAFAALKPDVAVEDWINTKLNKYIRNEMGTPEDPVRKLAERGVTHLQNPPEPDSRGWVEVYRQEAGFPREGLGQSPLAAGWENITDEMIAAQSAGRLRGALSEFEGAKTTSDLHAGIDKTLVKERVKQLEDTFKDTPSKDLADELDLDFEVTDANRAKVIEDRARTEVEGYYRGNAEDMLGPHSRHKVGLEAYDAGIRGEDLSWLGKIPEDQPVYAFAPTEYADPGFTHLIDELRNATRADSDLPANLRWKPEDLKKVTMEQAVERVAKINDWRAAQMEAAKKAAREGIPLHKEYEGGFQWMAAPDTAIDPKSLQYIKDVGCEGGWCTQGEELAKRYGADEGRLYVLHDSSGKPVVQIATKTTKREIPQREIPVEVTSELQQTAEKEARSIGEAQGFSPWSEEVANIAYGKYHDALDKWRSQNQQISTEILEIKGKQNRAPKEEHLPMVQDFVRSGNWSRVGDFANTGLYSADDVVTFMPKSFEMSRNARQLAIGRARQAGDLPKYMTMGEYEQILKKYAPEDIWKGKEPGYAKGGLVEDTDAIVAKLTGMDKDKALTQALRMANAKQEAHMAAGGLAKLLKGAKAAKATEKAAEVAKPAAKVVSESEALQKSKQAGYPMAPKDRWYGEGTYDKSGGRLEMISPDEFLRKVRPLKIDDASRDNIDDLKRHIQSGGELDPLLITKSGKEDGRHRAHAAKELGITKVPVIRYDKEVPAAPRAEALETARKNAVKMLGLPENNTAMDRAKALGFDTAGFRGSSVEETAHTKPIWWSEDPEYASAYAAHTVRPPKGKPDPYAGNVMPLLVKEGASKEFERFTPGGVPLDPFKGFNEGVETGFRRYAQNEITGDLGGKIWEGLTVPKNVRSRFAAFDPVRVNENDLLGAADPALLAGTAVASGIGLGALGQTKKRKPEQPEQKKAAGGLAKLLKGAKAAKEAEEAAKPAIRGTYQALPLQLPRAPNLPPQELTKTAERVARQQMGEHVRKSATEAQNLAGRSMKEAERLKQLNIKLQPTKEIPTPAVVPEEIGQVRIALPGDISVADKTLVSIDDMPIGAPQEGGPMYGAGKQDLEDPRFWASNEGPAQIFQNKVTDLANLYETPEVLAQHLAMGHDAMNFAQHFADANLLAIQASKVKAKDAKEFDRIIKEGFEKINPKTKERVRITFPDFPGIRNYEEAYKATQENPELRKWFNNRMKVEKITGPLGLPSGKEVEYAIMEPALSNMEHSMTGLSVGRMKPGASLIPGSEHKTYSHDIAGQALGRTKELTPIELAFPDASAYIRGTKRPQDFTPTIQKLFPHQVVDDQYINQLGEYYNRLKQIRGYKKGGAVKKSGLSVLNKAII